MTDEKEIDFGIIEIAYEEIVCEECGKKVEVQKGTCKDPLTGKRFCSKECFDEFDSKRSEEEIQSLTLKKIFGKK